MRVKPAGHVPAAPHKPPPPPSRPAAQEPLELAPPSTPAPPAVAVAAAKADDKAPAVQELEARATSFAVVAVADPAAFQTAADNLRELKTLQDQVETELQKATAPLNDALKVVRGWFKPIREKLEAAERDQRKALADYKTQQDRLEAEARRKRDADARAERERLEAEARAREAEAQREADAIREAAELERNKGNGAAAERLEAKATTTVTKAEATADNLRARAETVVAAPVAQAAPKAKGLSDRVVWKYRIKDASKLNPLFLCPNETKIAQQVKALKADAVALLGGERAVEVWSEADFSARRK